MSSQYTITNTNFYGIISPIIVNIANHDFECQYCSFRFCHNPNSEGGCIYVDTLSTNIRFICTELCNSSIINSELVGQAMHICSKNQEINGVIFDYISVFQTRNDRKGYSGIYIGACTFEGSSINTSYCLAWVTNGLFIYTNPIEPMISISYCIFCHSLNAGPTTFSEYCQCQFYYSLYINNTCDDSAYGVVRTYSHVNLTQCFFIDNIGKLFNTATSAASITTTNCWMPSGFESIGSGPIKHYSMLESSSTPLLSFITMIICNRISISSIIDSNIIKFHNFSLLLLVFTFFILYE